MSNLFDGAASALGNPSQASRYAPLNVPLVGPYRSGPMATAPPNPSILPANMSVDDARQFGTGFSDSNGRINHAYLVSKRGWAAHHTGAKQLIFAYSQPDSQARRTASYECKSLSSLNWHLKNDSRFIERYNTPIGADLIRSWRLVGVQLNEDENGVDREIDHKQVFTIGKRARAYNIWQALEVSFASHCIRQSESLVSTRIESLTESLVSTRVEMLVSSRIESLRERLVSSRVESLRESLAQIRDRESIRDSSEHNDANTLLTCMIRTVALVEQNKSRHRGGISVQELDKLFLVLVRRKFTPQEIENASLDPKTTHYWQWQPHISDTHQNPNPTLWSSDMRLDSIGRLLSPGWTGGFLYVGKMHSLHGAKAAGNSNNISVARQVLCPENDSIEYKYMLNNLSDIEIMLA